MEAEMLNISSVLIEPAENGFIVTICGRTLPDQVRVFVSFDAACAWIRERTSGDWRPK
jgi:hypothetical protein